MKPNIVQGDLLSQPTDVIVNPWNRNIIPWWLLLPQGVSGAIRKKGGTAPFKELTIFGPLELGGARLTSAGRLPFKGIIHVASIDLIWRATEKSIRLSVMNAMDLVNREGFKSVAFPLLGAGIGKKGRAFSLAVMQEALKTITTQAAVTLAVYGEHT